MLAGQKWAANLWVWNGPRATNPAVSSSTDGGGEQPLTATFESFDVPDVELFWTVKKYLSSSSSYLNKVFSFAGCELGRAADE